MPCLTRSPRGHPPGGLPGGVSVPGEALLCFPEARPPAFAGSRGPLGLGAPVLEPTPGGATFCRPGRLSGCRFLTATGVAAVLPEPPQPPLGPLPRSPAASSCLLWTSSASHKTQTLALSSAPSVSASIQGHSWGPGGPGKSGKEPLSPEGRTRGREGGSVGGFGKLVSLCFDGPPSEGPTSPSRFWVAVTGGFLSWEGSDPHHGVPGSWWLSPSRGLCAWAAQGQPEVRAAGTGGDSCLCEGGTRVCTHALTFGGRGACGRPEGPRACRPLPEGPASAWDWRPGEVTSAEDSWEK